MFFFGKKAVEAKLVGPNLVAAFHNAHPPLIWNFDLVRNHSFTIAMQGEEGDWELGITSPKGEFYPIAHFASRDDAEEAMARIQTLLMKSRRPKWIGWLKAIVIIIVVGLLLLGLASYLITRMATSMGMGGIGGGMGSAAMGGMMPQLAAPAAPAPTPMGVPLPADQVLQAPQ
jgi:hypothetical protein